MDSENRLVDCISISDLRVIKPTTERFSRLYDSVSNFREQSRQEDEFGIGGSQRRHARFAVTDDDTFEEVVCLMVASDLSQVSSLGRKPRNNEQMFSRDRSFDRSLLTNLFFSLLPHSLCSIGEISGVRRG